MYEAGVSGSHGLSAVNYYGSRNGFRMRDYHRLDLNASYQIKKTWVAHKITFSVYNAYARENPFYLEFGYANNEKVLKQVSLFPILPSLTYSINF
jgi:outer membrane cobalamin receptor